MLSDDTKSLPNPSISTMQSPDYDNRVKFFHPSCLSDSGRVDTAHFP